MLLAQLNWLADELVGLADQCNIVVRDNCSSDDTRQVIEQWKTTLDPAIDFTYYRHKKNIGGMPNIVSCIKHATGKFVWTLGDDDPIQKGAVSDILNYIKEYSNLGLILLNGHGRDMKTGNIKIKQWFHRPVDIPGPVHAGAFNYFLVHNSGGVLFISSAVYRTDLAQKALLAWPHSERNLAAQAFWVGYCAAHGSFIITSKLYTECAMGIGFTDKDPQWTFKMRYIDVPEVFNKLMRHGYDKKFCLFRILQNIKNKKAAKIILGSFRRWPLFATKGAYRYSKIVLKAMLFYSFGTIDVGAPKAAAEKLLPINPQAVNLEFVKQSSRQ
jgi:glycosyltransferase involved in cell wall biosynthesis